MKLTKKKVIVLLILFVTVFTGSYFYARVKYNKSKVNDKKEDNSILVNANKKEDEIFSQDGEIILRVKYSKSGNLKEDRMEAAGFSGAKISSVVSFFEGDGYTYLKNQSTNSKLVFEKSMLYEEGSYIIGEKDGYIAIYSVDSKGNLFIESDNDITSVKLDKFPEADQNLVKNNIKVFSSKDDAKDFIVETFES